MKEHYLYCEAPICCDDPNPNYKNEVVWFAGELICKKGPFQKFQKVQTDINKCFKRGIFKNVDTPYTANDLDTRSV